MIETMSVAKRKSSSYVTISIALLSFRSEEKEPSEDVEGNRLPFLIRESEGSLSSGDDSGYCIIEFEKMQDVCRKKKDVESSFLLYSGYQSVVRSDRVKWLGYTLEKSRSSRRGMSSRELRVKELT